MNTDDPQLMRYWDALTHIADRGTEQELRSLATQIGSDLAPQQIGDLITATILTMRALLTSLAARQN